MSWRGEVGIISGVEGSFGRPYLVRGNLKLPMVGSFSEGVVNLRLQHIELHLARLSHHLLESEKQTDNAANVGEYFFNSLTCSLQYTITPSNF